MNKDEDKLFKAIVTIKTVEEWKKFFHDLLNQISTKDIVSTYSGIRPLIEDFKTATKVTRDYVFDLNIVKKLPLLNIYGGKLTTYRMLSEKVLQDLKKYLPNTNKGPWTAKKKLL